MLCYLLSHVTASSLPAIQLVVLKITQGIRNVVKFRTLKPAIDAAVSGTAPALSDEVLALLLASADETLGTSLNDAKDSSWETYMKVLRFVFMQGSLHT